MTPATIVRRPRGPFTFIGMTGLCLERPAKPAPRANYHKCVALQDDGSPCGLPARYLDFKRGGHVCLDHRPNRKKEALCL